VPAQGSVEVRLRLCRQPVSLPFRDFDAILEQRKAEADSFYARVQAGLEDADARAVQRQAFAGLIWSKQFYYYDVPQWLQGDPAQPPPPTSAARAQLGVAAPQQRRRDLDAGQVGVSLVCGLGPGLPHAAFRADRCRALPSASWCC
jgi:hypothetical protein